MIEVAAPDPRTLTTAIADRLAEFIASEAQTAGAAAECATEKEIDALRKRVDEMRTASSDPPRYAEAYLAFHRDVARTARNEVALRTLSAGEHLLRGWIVQLVTRSETGALASLREHVVIFEAIAAGDSAAARHAMENHLHAGLRQLTAP